MYSAKASATLAFFFDFLSRFCDFTILRFCDFFKDYIGLQSKKDLPLFNEMVYPKKKSENRAIFFQEKNANVDSALVNYIFFTIFKTLIDWDSIYHMF